MRRIYLTKSEKQALRHIGLGYTEPPTGMDWPAFSDCATMLEHLGLVTVQWGSGHIACGTQLTPIGTAYLHNNPHLKNPINWGLITAVATASTAIITILAFFVKCST